MSTDKTLEQLFGMHLRGVPTTEADSANGQWAGLTVLNSGDTTVTVSTTAVRSGCVIMPIMQADTRQNSGFSQTVEVSSITDGTNFVLALSHGVALARQTTIGWLLFQT